MPVWEPTEPTTREVQSRCDRVTRASVNDPSEEFDKKDRFLEVEVLERLMQAVDLKKKRNPLLTAAPRRITIDPTWIFSSAQQTRRPSSDGAAPPRCPPSAAPVRLPPAVRATWPGSDDRCVTILVQSFSVRRYSWTRNGEFDRYEWRIPAWNGHEWTPKPWFQLRFRLGRNVFQGGVTRVTEVGRRSSWVPWWKQDSYPRPQKDYGCGHGSPPRSQLDFQISDTVRPLRVEESAPCLSHLINPVSWICPRQCFHPLPRMDD